MDKDSHEGEQMTRTFERGKTILVDGPASLTIFSGNAEVFGSLLRNGKKIVIREGKRLPITVEEAAEIEISVGEKANIQEISGRTIPSSWIKAYEELAHSQKRTLVAMVMGAVDSGKTSFCTYLTNRLLRENRKVALLDGDLGQSDIGPPCAIAYAFLTAPVVDLFTLKAENAFFVGVTSPSRAVDKVIKGLSLSLEEILNRNPDFVIVNTDGWIEGEDAVDYKVQLVETINPNILFFIQREHELTSLLDALERKRKTIVDSPSVIRQRSREKRKSLRELGYSKYLGKGKVRSIPLSWVRIEENEFIGLSLNHENRQKKGEEEGRLTALYDSESRFLGIGTLQQINYTRKVMKIFTPVLEEISIIAIGKIRLDKNLKEISTASPWEDHSDHTVLKRTP